MLNSLADFQIDYLLPSPSSSYQGCLRRELRYEHSLSRPAQGSVIIEDGWRNASAIIVKILDSSLRTHSHAKCNGCSGPTKQNVTTQAVGQLKEVTGTPELQSDESPTCKNWSSSRCGNARKTRWQKRKHWRLQRTSSRPRRYPTPLRYICWDSSMPPHCRQLPTSTERQKTSNRKYQKIMEASNRLPF